MKQCLLMPSSKKISVKRISQAKFFQHDFFYTFVTNSPNYSWIFFFQFENEGPLEKRAIKIDAYSKSNLTKKIETLPTDLCVNDTS